MNAILTYSKSATFEQQYNLLRNKEGSRYSDAALLLLPAVASAHPQSNEWQIRRRSLERMLDAVKQKGEKINILEIGCGNGWLAAKLAACTKGMVTGIDINKQELRQASRVFKHIPNLELINGNLHHEKLIDRRFDIILFAASVQYFPSLKKILASAMEYLTLQGEIHITDTAFYQRHELDAAKQKTKNYFTHLGCREMTAYYFHHCIDDLKKFHPNFIYDPRNILNRWFKKDPYYHVMIKNRYQ